MKCSNCKVEMEKGHLVQNGLAWSKVSQIGLKITKALSFGGSIVDAHKCPSCQNIQLFAEK